MRRLGMAVRYTLASAAIAAATCFTLPAEATSGCGSRGGPGYRGPDGKCVGWANIGRICGSPPEARCSAERADARAGDAADHGLRAIAPLFERRTR
jgi:hypothetical protein